MTTNNWSRKKGKERKAFGILTKLERKRRNKIQRTTLNHFFEVAAFGRGSAFGAEAARMTPSKDPNPPEAFSLFSHLHYSWWTTISQQKHT